MDKKIKIPVLSLNAKIEQFAKFLRTEATNASQLKKEDVKRIKPSRISKNKPLKTITQVAEKLKDGIQLNKTSKKRSA